MSVTIFKASMMNRDNGKLIFFCYDGYIQPSILNFGAIYQFKSYFQS